MPLRKLNYTNRKRILREHAVISIREERDGAHFDAMISLANYRLPDNARVYVEAYRQTHYMRFDFGRVGAIDPPTDRRLSEFSCTDGILFRLKVVAIAERPGLLLAEADQIRPRSSAETDESRIPLLHVVGDDSLGDEIWRLDFDGKQTLLQVNSTMGDWRAIARAPEFIALVYPVVLRTILWRVLRHEKHFSMDDPDDWRSRWLQFASRLPGVGDPPDDEDDEAQCEDWIDSAVAAFCSRKQIRTTYTNYMRGEQE